MASSYNTLNSNGNIDPIENFFIYKIHEEDGTYFALQHVDESIAAESDIKFIVAVELRHY